MRKYKEMSKFKIGDLVMLWDYEDSAMPSEYSGKVGRIVRLPVEYAMDVYRVEFFCDDPFWYGWFCKEKDLTKVDCVLDITWRSR